VTNLDKPKCARCADAGIDLPAVTCRFEQPVCGDCADEFDDAAARELALRFPVNESEAS
jgi:hypothetical protein